MTLYRILVLVGFLVDVHGLNATDKERHYVKENESVTLMCPYMPRSDSPIVWIKSNTKIAEGRNVNNDNKYSITGNNSREQNLRIANISQENIGEYRCDAVQNERPVSYYFELLVCSIPHDMNHYNLHVLDSIDGHVKNMLCKRTQMEANNLNDHIMQEVKIGENFTCAALTHKQCLTADKNFMVQIFWNNNSKNKCTVHTINSNSSVIYVVCDCNYSKPTGESLTKSFDGLYHVDTLYLKNILTLDISHCHCDVVSDDSQCKNDLFSSRHRLQKGVVASLMLSLTVLCIFVAIGIYLFIIKDKESPARRICQNWNRASAHNIINNCGDQNVFYLANDVNLNMAERPGNELEGYSSIDKRLVLGIGVQQVSYLSYSGASPENSRETRTKNQTNNDKAVDQLQHEELQLCNKEPTILPNLLLNYIDVMFDSTQNTPKFYIRGDNIKTPYAEIDFTLHADPLPDIDSSEGDEGESDDDFMSLSGIQNWMNPS